MGNNAFIVHFGWFCCVDKVQIIDFSR